MELSDSALPLTKTYLDEGLDLAPLLNALLAHAAGDLAGVAVDTSNDGVGVRSLLQRPIRSQVSF